MTNVLVNRYFTIADFLILFLTYQMSNELKKASKVLVESAKTNKGGTAQEKSPFCF